MSLTLNVRGLSYEELRNHFVVRNVVDGLQTLLEDRVTKLSLAFLLIVLLMALFGPLVTPFEYDKQIFAPDGGLARLQEPSTTHLLGTTARANDIFSRILYGARPTAVTGLVGGSMIISIGLSIGVPAGYIGGKVDSILMRFTDFVYGVPLIPFAIVLVAFVGVGFWTTIFILGIILWRGNARVLRSQVLQIRERPFIKSAKALGASNRHIIFKHVLPNIAGMAVLFFSLGVGFAIIFQANLAFIGVSNPFLPSWGIMVRNAYTAGYAAAAPWWSIPPGLLISFTVLSTFLLGRGYERMTNVDQGDLET